MIKLKKCSPPKCSQLSYTCYSILVYKLTKTLVFNKKNILIIRKGWKVELVKKTELGRKGKVGEIRK